MKLSHIHEAGSYWGTRGTFVMEVTVMSWWWKPKPQCFPEPNQTTTVRWGCVCVCVLLFKDIDLFSRSGMRMCWFSRCQLTERVINLLPKISTSLSVQLCLFTEVDKWKVKGRRSYSCPVSDVLGLNTWACRKVPSLKIRAAAIHVTGF